MLKRLSELLSRKTAAGGRKVSTMPDASEKQLVDVNQQIAALTSAVQQLADSQKALIERLQAPAAAAPGAADVQRLVNQSLANQQQASRLSGARDRYISEKMSDLPSIYRDQLPVTDDPATLTAQEQQIRERFRADFKLAHPNGAHSVGPGALGGVKPAEVIDLSRLSPTQLIAKGLERATPAAPATRTQPSEAAPA